MKIFFDYKIFQQEFGGPSRYFFELFEALNKLNKEAFILSPIYLNQYLQNSNFPKNIIGKKINSKRLLSKFYKVINKNISKIICKKNVPDLIHTTYYDNILIANKKPIIVTIHDLIHEIFHYEFRLDKDARPKKKILEKADRIICVSNSTKKDLLRYYNVNENKIFVIYHGKPYADLTFNNNLSYEKPFFLYVGGRKRYKNFRILLDAYSKLENIKKNFDIVCFGGGKFLKEEIEYMKKIFINPENIHQFEGGDNLLVSFYKNCEALIYPSKYEGFGLPILEAMSLGCPILSSNTSSLPEIYGDAALTFSPDSIENLIDCIKKITSDDDLKKNLIKKGLNREKNFSWEKCALETYNVYKKLF